MYSKPNMNRPTDRLAHVLSEMYNDNAPLGWERYRPLASMLPISTAVNDARFLDSNWQPGKDDPKFNAD